MHATEERERWQRRVVRAAQSRWGHRLRSVVAHTDETYYHLHLWVDDDGRPVKRFHAGHGAVLEQPAGTPRKQLAEAYRAGCRFALDWYHHWVGSVMGWARSMSPRPRLSRGAAARRRQQELEAREELVQAQLAKNKRELAAIREADEEATRAAELAMRTLARVQAAEAAWKQEKARQKAVIKDALQKLHAMAAGVQDQAALEKRLEGLKIDPKLFGSLFR